MNRISMSQRELDKYEVIKRSLRKEITVKKAGELLNLCQRQIYRLRSKAKKEGAKAFVHGNKGRESNRKMPKKERQKIINLLHGHYSDFKPLHAKEKLEERHDLKRDPGTIRQIMIEEGFWKPKRRKKAVYRSKRPPKEHYGEMEQFDGSYHRWFEERGPSCCLLASIDDATGKITKAEFKNDEGTLSVFDFWKGYFLSKGKPRSIYLDRLRTYYNNILPERDEEALTQFQRAMKEMAVETIVAYSPQAKGKVEKLFKTLQDRLIKEMRLRNISDIPPADRFLEEEFIPWFNARYGKEAKKKANLHRKLSKREKERLPSIFSRQSERIVQNDFTVRFNNLWYQLLKDQPATVRPKERIIVEERIGGQIFLRLREKYLNYQVLTAKPEKKRNQSWIIPANQKERKPRKPSQDHPWRSFKINPKPDISKSLKT